MNASESQHILSRLYTDQVYRQAFLAGKDAFYKTYGISDPESIAFLNALKPEQLEFFAKGLYAKKYHEVMHQIPGTVFLLKDKLGALFREFSQTPVTYGVHRHHEEALAFLKFIEKDSSHSPLVKTILKFEKALITNFISPKNWKILIVKFNPVLFLKELQLQGHPVIKKKLTLIIFRNGKIGYVY
jgi:hypothetical protein